LLFIVLNLILFRHTTFSMVYRIYSIISLIKEYLEWKSQKVEKKEE
jgi:hypothetical protein